MQRAFSFALLWALLSLGYTANAQATTDNLKWEHRYEEAARQAAADHKPILMVFAGSDWCKPCILLRREVWDTPAFRDYAKEHFVLLELDFPRFKKNQLPEEQKKYNEQLADKYNQEGLFPLVVLTDEKGNVLGKTGYQPGGPDKYIPHLEQLLHQK
ncbi:thioredoxin family protein [Pontibacter sp. HSC-36F09]|uniref:thioredoxin family protein n=1 Tax=Pontibacter sp. HSC-36F09 TaxID=2910966 RepID=UPI00209EF2C8|nr:thioredoxin family protein [Pontibacter sp. HSC-36F09]MCP2044320.1 thioredoxin-related protein [Pontibacter sp. HSC-36F09]